LETMCLYERRTLLSVERHLDCARVDEIRGDTELSGTKLKIS